MKLKVLVSVLLTLCIVPPAFASKESHVKKGNAFYKKGDFDSSLENYREALRLAPESPEVNFNLGTVLYKNKKYADAVPYLQKGLLSNDPTVKKNAHFNLGDALFATGLQFEGQDVNQAIENLEESMRQFDTVMNLDDKDQDARYNQDIVKKELVRLKKKQEQQKKNKEQKQDQDQQQKDQQQDQNKDSSGDNSDSKQDHSPQQDSQPDKKEDDKKQPFKPEGQPKDQGAEDRKDEGQQAKSPGPGEMSEEEAKNLLKQFEQNEQPAGLLNFKMKKSDDRPVLKDW